MPTRIVACGQSSAEEFLSTIRLASVARRAGRPDLRSATPDMYSYRRTTARRHIRSVAIRSRVERVRPQHGVRFRAYADDSPDRKMWLTTEAQLRPSDIDAAPNELADIRTTRAGALSNEADEAAVR